MLFEQVELRAQLKGGAGSILWALYEETHGVLKVFLVKVEMVAKLMKEGVNPWKMEYAATMMEERSTRPNLWKIELAAEMMKEGM